MAIRFKRVQRLCDPTNLFCRFLFDFTSFFKEKGSSNMLYSR